MAKKKQQELPGMERKTVKELDDAAEHYVAMRDIRIRASENESDAKQTLIAAMRKHEILSYRVADGSLVVTLASKDNVKVTEAEEEAQTEEDAA